MRDVADPMSVAAVMTSNSSGIWGVQTESKPASSAQRASAWSFSTLVAYRPRSALTCRPMRIGAPFLRKWCSQKQYILLSLAARKA